MIKIIVTESQLKKILNKVLNEDVPLLRKLSYKSVLWFGQYKDVSIQQLLHLGKTRYLRGLYYDISGISFLDEILKDLRIFGDDFDYRIEKPGTDHEMKEMLDDMRDQNINNIQKKHIQKIKKAKMVGRSFVDSRKFSKGSLQAWNQGKK